jgi:hypothetical protein
LAATEENRKAVALSTGGDFAARVGMDARQGGDAFPAPFTTARPGGGRPITKAEVLLYDSCRFGSDGAWRIEMGKKGIKLRAWTTVDVRMLKTLAHEKTKTTEIAHRLNRSVEATHQQAMRLGVTLGAGRKKRA